MEENKWTKNDCLSHISKNSLITVKKIVSHKIMIFKMIFIFINLDIQHEHLLVPCKESPKH